MNYPMNVVAQVRHPSSMFSHSLVRKEYVADASMLDMGGTRDRDGRIYQDAADVGFAMVSGATGKEAIFSLTQTHKRNGDVTHWEYEPIPETLRYLPQLRGYRVLVWNT